MISLTVLLLSGIFIEHVLSYPYQVPKDACDTMIPGHHNIQPQKSQSPYKLEVSNQKIGKFTNMTVLLKGDVDFLGFYVQARTMKNFPIGEFFHQPSDSTINVHNCSNNMNNAIFHGSKGVRNNVIVTWNPLDYKGNVTFVATFVQTFNIFWIQVKSVIVTVI